MTKKIISKIGDYRQPLPETIKEPLLDFMEDEEINTLILDDYEEFNEKKVLDNADKLSESGLFDEMLAPSKKRRG